MDTDSRRILADVHNMLSQLVKRVESTENELKEMRKKMSTCTPSTSDSGHKKN